MYCSILINVWNAANLNPFAGKSPKQAIICIFWYPRQVRSMPENSVPAGEGTKNAEYFYLPKPNNTKIVFLRLQNSITPLRQKTK